MTASRRPCEGLASALEAAILAAGPAREAAGNAVAAEAVAAEAVAGAPGAT